jgi:sugar phosphate isomerase/epimerase
MKLSFVISTQPTHFQAVTFSPDFEANAARLAKLGYDGIELAVRDPATLDFQRVRRILDTHHLLVPAIGTGQAWGEEHLSFTDPAAAVRQRAGDRFRSHIPLARAFGAIIIIGLLRGTVQPDVSPDQAHHWLVDALKTAARLAQEQGVRIALEPINRYETNLLNDVAETRSLLDEIGADNIGILFDTFHSNIEEPNIEASLRACGTRLFHVHLADSNRWAPGVGHIDFSRIVATLRDMKYSGWLSAEILPKPSIERAQEQTIQTMRPMLA